MSTNSIYLKEMGITEWTSHDAILEDTQAMIAVASIPAWGAPVRWVVFKRFIVHPSSTRHGPKTH
jgi:hypothetical protein